MAAETPGGRYCPRCGAAVRSSARYCGRCQAELPSRVGAAPAPALAAFGRRRRYGWAVVAVLVVLLPAGVVAYLELSGRAAVSSSAPAAKVAVTPTSYPTPYPTSTPTPYVTPTATPTPVSTDETAVLTAVQDHWDAIRDHRFQDAYAYLGPDLATGESQWVSSHENDGITGVLYQFRVRDVSGDTATVDVVLLQTRAGSAQSGSNPNGCLSWTGSYGLIRQGNRWLIDQAHISPSPCG